MANGWDPGRPIDLALARVHLRTGTLGLARAELEAIAGSGELDDDGLLDLAEARWRTGDLGGAGDAAQAYLTAGGDSPVALVIAAEATAALGRPGEARTLAGRALEAVHGPIDPIFAGMPRSPVWPADAIAGDATDAERPAGHAVASRAFDPAAELDTARAAIAAGDPDRAAVHLALVVRRAPALAPAVLEAIDRPASALLHLVRGDAYRALGNEPEADVAWAKAADAARGTPPPKEES